MANLPIPIMPQSQPFRSLRECQRLVEQFEDCSLTRSEWDHCAHLSVAFWYLFHLEEAEATERMIRGILRFNHSKGIAATKSGGYHETITLFWLALTRRHLQAAPEGCCALECVNGLIARYAGCKEILFEYYSRQRIFSWRARRTWVPPDLKPLEVSRQDAKAQR